MQKRNHWFRNYQAIPQCGISGMRRLENRAMFFRNEDFAGKSVLDLGCNSGQMSFFAAERGASQVLGVEFDAEAFQQAMSLRDRAAIANVRLKLDDFENPFFWHEIPAFDTVLFLSLIDTKELENRFGTLAKVCMRTRNVLYFEGHQKQPHLKYLDMLQRHSDFTQIEHLGSTEGRAFFRCSREVLNAANGIEAIRAAAEKYDRIAITGNQMAGKSTLLQRLGQVDGFEVLDDCDDVSRLLKIDRLVLADYRALQYLDDFDAVFHLISPLEQPEARRPNLPFTRSSSARPFRRMQAIYTINPRADL